MEKRLRNELLRFPGAVEVRSRRRWVCVVEGPPGSPYEGGAFPVELAFPRTYPFHAAPVPCTFQVPLFHCNVDANGHVCAAALPAPSPNMDASRILRALAALLAQCQPEAPLVAEIAQLYRTCRTRHDAIARAWTRAHAARALSAETPAQSSLKRSSESSDSKDAAPGAK